MTEKEFMEMSVREQMEALRKAQTLVTAVTASLTELDRRLTAIEERANKAEADSFEGWNKIVDRLTALEEAAHGHASGRDPFLNTTLPLYPPEQSEQNAPEDQEDDSTDQSRSVAAKEGVHVGSSIVITIKDGTKWHLFDDGTGEYEKIFNRFIALYKNTKGSKGFVRPDYDYFKSNEELEAEGPK